MHPVFYEFDLFGFHRVVAGYGSMLVAGIILGLGTAMALARRRGVDPINALLVALIAVGAGIVGSYLVFLLTVLPELVVDPSIALQGGLVFYGGPLAGVPAAALACRWFRIPALHMADLAAPALTIGHAMGRLGCFLGGCCFGRPWDGPFAVTFTHVLAPAAHPSVPRHPVQLYEAAVLLAISLATQLLWRRSTHAGQVGLLYLIAYALWRFVVETMRADDVRGFVVPGLVSTSQAIALAVVPFAVLGLYLLHWRRPAASA